MDILRWLTIFAATILALTFAGCSALESDPLDHAIIVDYGQINDSYDNSRIEIYSAKPGLQGVTTIETDDGIDVTLHYNKK